MAEISDGISFSRIEFYITIFTAAAGLAAAIFWIGNIASQITVNTEHLKTVDARLNLTETEQRHQDIDIAKLIRDQDKISSEFCGDDQIRNLMHANELRIEAILWSKVFTTTYPTDNTYYPTLCQRLPSEQPEQ